MVRAASAHLLKHMASTRQMGSLRSCCSRSLPCERRRPRCAPAAAVHWAFWQLATSWHLTRQQQFALHAASVALHSTDSGATAAAGSAASPSTQPSELEGRLLDMHIGPGLRLMEQRFDIHGHVFTMLAPHDVDQVLDMYIEAGIDGDPYWCRVWPSAIGLAQLLLSRPELVRGKRVADIGCGLGVAGVAAALAGASEVVLLDREPLALQCALESAVASGVANVLVGDDVSGEQTRGRRDGNAASSSQAGVDALHHRASSSGSASTSGRPPAAAAGALTARRFDWSAADVAAAAGGKFDVLLACDVLYEAEAVSPLSSVMPQLLKSSSGLLLLADPTNRTASTLNREAFLAKLAAAPAPGGGCFSVDACYTHACEINQLDREMSGGLHGSETVPVQLLLVRRSAGNTTVGLKQWVSA